MLEPPLGALDAKISRRRQSPETGAVRRRMEKARPASCATASPISNWKPKSMSRRLPSGPKSRALGARPNRLRDVALPTVMRKMVEHGLAMTARCSGQDKP